MTPPDVDVCVDPAANVPVEPAKHLAFVQSVSAANTTDPTFVALVRNPSRHSSYSLLFRSLPDFVPVSLSNNDW